MSLFVNRIKYYIVLNPNGTKYIHRNETYLLFGIIFYRNKRKASIHIVYFLHYMYNYTFKGVR